LEEIIEKDKAEFKELIRKEKSDSKELQEEILKKSKRQSVKRDSMNVLQKDLIKDALQSFWS
jgi:hypothetical protein